MAAPRNGPLQEIKVTQIHKGCGSGCGTAVIVMIALVIALGFIARCQWFPKDNGNPSPSPAPASPAPTIALHDPTKAVVTKDTSISVPYGVVGISRGTVVKVIRLNGDRLEIEYLGERRSIPVANTDYRPSVVP